MELCVQLQINNMTDTVKHHHMTRKKHKNIQSNLLSDMIGRFFAFLAARVFNGFEARFLFSFCEHNTGVFGVCAGGFIVLRRLQDNAESHMPQIPQTHTCVDSRLYTLGPQSPSADCSPPSLEPAALVFEKPRPRASLFFMGVTRSFEWASLSSGQAPFFFNLVIPRQIAGSYSAFCYRAGVPELSSPSQK